MLGNQGRYLRGSAIFPSIAVAALHAGDMRCTMPPLPILPLKFLLVVAAQTSPSAITPVLIPRHAPQVGFVTQKPASMKISMRPSFIASWKTFGVAGDSIPLTV